jgi:hypothetical protein
MVSGGLGQGLEVEAGQALHALLQNGCDCLQQIFIDVERKHMKTDVGLAQAHGAEVQRSALLLREG